MLQNILHSGTPASKALAQLETLKKKAILFLTDEENTLIGSITDGDIRRGLLKGLSLNNPVDDFVQSNPVSVNANNPNVEQIKELRELGYKILPVVNSKGQIQSLLDFSETKTILPLHAVIMAGGEGRRLRPYTEQLPKPLLKVGDKPIVQYTLEKFAKYGIKTVEISINYLGHKLIEEFGNGEKLNLSISYITEDKPLGTIGSVNNSTYSGNYDFIIQNSDLLCDVDMEQMYLYFKQQQADFLVLSVPYAVNIPFAVLRNEGLMVKELQEKPTYNYYCNGGIYFIKKDVLQHIPAGTFYNTTDLMDFLILNNYRVLDYKHHGYWLDIGSHSDFNKAQNDIKELRF